MKVSYNDEKWRVTRRWLPWRRRVRGAGKAWDLVPSLPAGDDPVSGAITLVVLVIFAPVIAVAVVLTVLAAIEFAVLLLLVPFLAVARMAFGRHWVVEVRRGFTPYYEEHAGDWAASSERIRQLAASISRGDLPLHTLGDDAGPVSPS
ncbi:hypothetical protein [Nocardioides bizhenqiangii]|uniref:DUF983 domain-containing protein n=1 Tax=Nocardioides bizhenqiangii TaxID=3095076 RepID=A0ABZ0ZN23_9ACTN|nr:MULTISPECIES: hypothetical protein [unclassified Nocardioides]MDZ5621540.1 hypothetical protein [Nocardioides sp. HM23]WQQ25623.1 hypothetical protein SHK19_16850 [Nocardioides sp. HM61]